MKIIVTGSRDWEDRDFVWHSLDTFYGASTLRGETFYLGHGACPTGADLHSDEWADARQWSSGSPIYVRPYDADWYDPCRPDCRHRPRKPGRSAELPAHGETAG